MDPVEQFKIKMTTLKCLLKWGYIDIETFIEEFKASQWLISDQEWEELAIWMKVREH